MLTAFPVLAKLSDFFNNSKEKKVEISYPMQIITKFRKRSKHLPHPLYDANSINLIPKPDRARGKRKPRC